MVLCVAFCLTACSPSSEVVWFMMLRVVAAFPFLATLPKMVADLGCKFGEPYMRDKRDAPYFLPTVFLTIYAPTLFLWALYVSGLLARCFPMLIALGAGTATSTMALRCRRW